MNEIREVTQSLWRLLKYNGYPAPADLIEQYLRGSDTELLQFLSSDYLWSKPSCVMECAFMDNPYYRHKLQALAIEIGLILESYQINNRQAGAWISAFTQWRRERVYG